ncbi:hypothetical protein HAZT_HAZT002206 [Hyalella azteca]|uniref:G-protein coupled receptors family 1 profile domain-containing protein n=1 Tax=Hyalella azteca TaxID=294128 RepID=A0A6A0HDI4_HYAAZ|nr:hypothetical protein HAZT_HAZT002206 [Hyalella azteca]
MIALPLLIAAGITGNGMSVWVLLVSPLRGLSSSFYLSALCASDSGFLFCLFFVWLKGMGTDLYNQNGWCQGITYVCHVTTFLSVWLVVAFTTERFVAVCFPFLRPIVCTVRRAKTVILVIIAVAMTLYFYLLATAGIVTISGSSYCTLVGTYEAVGHVMNHVDTVLTMLVPLVIIVTLNVKIVRCVRYVEKLRCQMLTLDLASKAPPSQIRVTKTLLVISSVFILLNLPSYGLRAMQYITVSFWVHCAC